MKSVAWKGDHPITSYYGWRTNPISGVRSFHDGVDVSMPVGTELYSLVNGKVRIAKADANGGKYIKLYLQMRKDTGVYTCLSIRLKLGILLIKDNL